MNIFEGSIPAIWESVVKRLLDTPGGELSSVIMSSRESLNSEIVDSTPANHRLDSYLASISKPSTHTVANTIFPVSLWNPGGPRSDLFDRYEKIWPKIKHHRANNNGVYFRRFTHYETSKGVYINQLDKIIDYYLGGTHRRSMTQLAVYSPSKDLVRSRQRGFPCLQHVSATVTNKQLTVSGMYVMQHAVPKLYGNLVGLRNLGKFIAHELGVDLGKTVCIAHHELLGATKTNSKKLFPKE